MCRKILPFAKHRNTRINGFHHPSYKCVAILTENKLLGSMQRQAVGAKPADWLKFSLFRKVSSSFQVLLTFIRLPKMTNATKPRGKWSVSFALNTLTDCKLAWCSGHRLSANLGTLCSTLVPLCQGANESSIICLSLLKKKPKKKHTRSLRQDWKTEMDSRHRVH